MKRVRVTIVGIEKQLVLRGLSVCVCIHFIQHTKRLGPIVLSSAARPDVQNVFQIV
jgi:hypothetical protein